MFITILVYALALSYSGAITVAPATINGLVAASVVEKTVVVTYKIMK